MQNVESKAREWISENMEFGQPSLEMLVSLTKLLKEQGKETRKACSRAVFELPPEMFSGADRLVKVSQATHACMNVKAL